MASLSKICGMCIKSRQVVPSIEETAIQLQMWGRCQRNLKIANMSAHPFQFIWIMIKPKRHCETLFDLNQQEWNDIQQLLQQVKQHLDEKYNPDGYNVGWNCGAVGGQEMFHTHMHVIPRFADEPYAGKGIRYWLKQEGNLRHRE